MLQLDPKKARGKALMDGDMILLYSAAINHQPIGGGIIDRCVKKYPECFYDDGEKPRRFLNRDKTESGTTKYDRDS